MNLYEQLMIGFNGGCGLNEGIIYGIKGGVQADFKFSRQYDATRFNENKIMVTTIGDRPRRDYNLNRTCPAWLLEPASTNFISFSNDFGQISWNKFRSVLLENIAIGLDGLQSASKINQNNVNPVHGGLSSTVQYIAGEYYVSSMFVKASEYSWIELAENSSLSGQNISTWFDVKNGLVGNLGAGHSAKIQDCGNGWFRCSIIFIAEVTSASLLSTMYLSNSNGSTNATIVGGVYIWGAQLEQNHYPTSYVETTGLSHIRNADLLESKGAQINYNSPKGTLFLRTKAIANVNDGFYFTISDNTILNVITLRYLNNGISAAMRVNGVQIAAFSTQILDINSFRNIALRWAENDFALYVDGVEIGSSNSNITFTDNVLTHSKFFDTDGSNIFYGWVDEMDIFDNNEIDLADLTGYDSYGSMAENFNYNLQ